MPALKSETLHVIHSKFENDNFHVQPVPKLYRYSKFKKSVHEQDEF